MSEETTRTAASLDLEGAMTCGVCGEASEVHVEDTDTWHEIACGTCGQVFAVSLDALAQEPERRGWG